MRKVFNFPVIYTIICVLSITLALMSGCESSSADAPDGFRKVTGNVVSNYRMDEIEHIETTCRYIRSEKGITPSLVQPETCKEKMNLNN
ncbi:hypothetical protein [Bacillus paranthracis]|uniref:hypothetical protein n=1 Tax=Bacillus paranthracis TaxID=2026186 RepID=UPI0022E15417|nr:hypothetical protein [Bacillus paranthracis]